MKFSGLAEANEAVRSWASERTFIMIKPDGVARGLVGEIIQRFEDKGFKMVALKFICPLLTILEQHYEALKTRPFFPRLLKYMSSGPVVATVWEGFNVVKCARNLIGATNPLECSPGTIRGDFCLQTGRNIIHGSDSVISANREISLWFENWELA